MISIYLPQIGLIIADGVLGSLLVLKKNMTPPQILFLMYFVNPLTAMGSNHPRDCWSDMPRTNVGCKNDVTSQSTIVLYKKIQYMSRNQVC